VTTGDLFAKKTEVREVWVGGRRFVVTPPADQGLDGSWAWSSGWPGAGAAPTLRIAGTKLTAKAGDAELEVLDPSRDDRSLQCRLRGESLGQGGTFWLRLQRSGDGLVGTLTTPDLRTLAVRATADGTAADGKTDGASDEKGKKDKDDEPSFTPPDLDPLPTPLGGYGFGDDAGEAGEFAIVGASLWTSDGRGVLRNGAVHVRDGKHRLRRRARELPACRPTCRSSTRGQARHARR
jgi:hypothetical protein